MKKLLLISLTITSALQSMEQSQGGGSSAGATPYRVDMMQQRPGAAQQRPDDRIMELLHRLSRPQEQIPAELIAHLQTCRLLDISGIEALMLTDETLKTIVRLCPQLQEVIIHSSSRITGVGLRDLVKRCHNLTHLTLRWSSNITDADIVRLPTIDRTTGTVRNLNLTHIDLDECSAITDLSLYALAIACPSLTSVKLSGCYQITDNGIAALVEGCPRLTTIDLDHCDKVTNAGIMAIAAHCHALTTLTISKRHGITYGNQSITDEGITALAQNCPELRNITIGDHYAVTEASIAALKRHCPHLEQVYLHDCNVGIYRSEDIVALQARYPGIRLYAKDETPISEIM